jgi:SAM-dependent methyltransferase
MISQYKYSKTPDRTYRDIKSITQGAIELGHERLNPNLGNPDFLILRQRRKHLSQWLQGLTEPNLQVLDVGGRIQPYRPLLEGRLRFYIAIDPQLTGVLDVIAVGEHLPFQNEIFGLVICTQTLGYVTNPSQVIAEIYRVLIPGGALFLSVPAFFPRHEDERWRFLPEGLSVLLSHFSHLEIAPEGFALAGLFRTFNVCLYMFFKNETLRRLLSSVVFPIANLSGLVLDNLSRGNDQLTANYCALARK